MNSAGKKFAGIRPPGTRKDIAYDMAKDSPIKMPAVILVNPFLDANVGSVSRAMLNFGLSELRVVDPRCDIMSEQSQALAAGAIDILRNAKIYSNLKDCVSDLQRVIATTARTRDMSQSILTPQSAAKIAINQSNNISVGILFGRERDGLSNEELSFADSYVAIPSFQYFSSLNLAQAVNILAYELFKQKLEVEQTPLADELFIFREGDKLAKREDLDNYLTRLETQLINRNYQPDKYRREAIFRNIRNIYQRVQITKAEIDTLHGVLTTLIKAIPVDESNE